MQLGEFLPYPNPMPGGGGVAPPPGMGAPPAMPSADHYIQMVASLYGETPNDIKAFMGGIGFMELLKKMDLGKRQRGGGSGLPVGPAMTPQLAALKSAAMPPSSAAPLASLGVGGL